MMETECVARHQLSYIINHTKPKSIPQNPLSLNREIMGKMINFSAILLLVLLVTTGLMEKGEAQAQGCEWECKHLPNFRCWLGDEGHRLCHDVCKSEGAITGVCVPDSPGISHHCLCRKAGCS